MSASSALDRLEAPEYRRHQRREWWVERIGWLAMLVLVVAGIAGIFGSGPATRRADAGGDGALVVEYSSVERVEAPAQLTIRTRPPRSRSDAPPAAEASPAVWRLLVSRSFADRVTPEVIVPRPETVSQVGDDVAYTFIARSGDPQRVVFRYHYDEFGSFEHRVATDAGASVVFRQRVLP
jgi:hypothetical protein